MQSMLKDLQRLLPSEFMTHEGHAAMYMTLAMTVLFFGYEFSRAGMLSLFTSSKTGFSSPSAYSIAMSCVSPFSVLVVMWYGHQLDSTGPRKALRHTTIVSAIIIFLSGVFVYSLEYKMEHAITKDEQITWNNACKAIVWTSFVYQNSYIQLLCTQHWSFLGSILSKTQGKKYFASIAGLSSISSTIAGTLIPSVVHRFGLNGLLMISSLSLVITASLADHAYCISQQNGFDPTQKSKKEESSCCKKTLKSNKKNKNMLTKAIDLFGRVPLLAVLFLEVICFQMMVAIINLSFMTKVKAEMPVDATRAVWTGKFYSVVNGSSAILQFLALPFLMEQVKPEWLWRLMPLLPMMCSFSQCLQNEPSLWLVAFSLFSAKCVDYAMRNVVSELVFLSLDFESRYFGKEIIGLCGNKLGKSMISLFLSILPYIMGNKTTIRGLAMLAFASSLCWCGCTFRLSQLVTSPAVKAGKDEVDTKKVQ